MQPCGESESNEQLDVKADAKSADVLPDPCTSVAQWLPLRR